MFKKEIVKILSRHVNLKEEKIESLLETPLDSELADYAFPCFVLAKKYKKSPVEIAKQLASRIKIGKGKEIENIGVIGPYINFFINKKRLAERIIKIKEDYGKKKGKQKIMVEFPSPNTNKPLHLGHLRNMAIGESVSRLLEFAGNEVIRVNLNNDRGVHICKSMVAYKKWGKDETPEKKGKKSDHFIGEYYVLFRDKSKEEDLEQEVQECLKKWEEGDKETLILWKKMNKWALQGFKETYNTF
jgi:arginyl-tRNA synthetase